MELIATALGTLTGIRDMWVGDIDFILFFARPGLSLAAVLGIL